MAGGEGWSLMATGLNTFCTWQWTTTATTTAYGDAVGNNFWLYFWSARGWGRDAGCGMRDAAALEHFFGGGVCSMLA